MPLAVDGPPSARSRPHLWRITDRRSFADLQRQGRRARVGAVTVTWMAPTGAPTDPPRAGFNVGRRTGGSVVRNRVRRRLRAGLRELLRTGQLPAGTYLLGATGAVADQPWERLRADLAEAVAEVTR
jgi:ribonuclease P protein component